MTVSLSSSSVALANTSTTTAAQEDTTTAALDKVSPALGKAHGRVQSQLQSHSASLSQLGKYKATVADLSSAAQSLSQLGSSSASVADNTKVVERFVAAYNQAIKASQPDTTSEASSTLASSRRALTNTDTSRSQLAKLGLTRQADGTLRLDTAALSKALATSAAAGAGTTSNTASASATGTTLSTLAQLGKAIGKRADNELASGSRLATATNLYSGKTALLKQQQTRLLEAATQMSSQASTGVNTGNWSTQQALRKYSV